MEITFTLNGDSVTCSGNPERSLLRFLRDDQHIFSVKDGCSGQAFCGACLVELDGKPALSCRTSMEKVNGRSVRTLEGFPADVKKAAASVFVKGGAVQCGFCSPGILTRILIFLTDNTNPDRAQVEKALAGHYCRCTGYVKVIDSTLKAARILRERGAGIDGSQNISDESKEIDLTGSGKVGENRAKYGAMERILGKGVFTDDLYFDNMVHGVLLFSPCPRGKIISIDTTAAETMPGVTGIFTWKDIPGDRISGLIVKDWPMMIAPGETTRYLGDVLAVITADTREQAEAARDAVLLEYEELQPVTDMEEALENVVSVHESGNLLEKTEIHRGDNIDAVLGNSAHVVTGTFTTQRIEHGFMEPECAVARPWSTVENGIELFVQSQGVYEDRTQLSALLVIPEEKINVNLHPAGGGFGGKEDLSVQHHAALGAYHLKRPVKIRLTREESIRMHPKRHPMKMEYTLGCDDKGMFTGIKVRILGDTGAYASVGGKVLERAAGHATGGYAVQNAMIDAYAVYTNNVPCGAMRGFGVNQTAFAMEAAVDELCDLGGFDRWQIRYDNALVEGSMTATGQILEHAVGVRACLEALKPQYDKYPEAGIACGIKNCGIGNGMVDEAEAIIEFSGNGSVVIHHGWTEMGQGVDTVALQVFCETTGISPDIVDVKVSTQFGARAGMTTASRGTVLLGNAVINAAEKVNEAVNAAGGLDHLEQLTGRKFHGKWACDWTTKPGTASALGKPEVTHFGYGYAAQLIVLDDAGNVDTVYAAHDAGRIINPVLYQGQIEGAVLMGLGYAFSEDLPMKDGYFTSMKMKDIGLPRVKDVPTIVVIPVEVNDPVGPYGAKGVGEIGLVPTAAAAANAVARFTGKRHYSLPMGRKIRGASGV